MSMSQWLRVRSMIVLGVAIVARALLFLLPDTEPEHGSLLAAVVDYLTSVTVVVAVLGLGWSTGTAAHRTVTAWYERRLAAGMLGSGTPAPARPWRVVVTRGSWTLFTHRLHTIAARTHWRRLSGFAVMFLALQLTWYTAADAAGTPSSASRAATRSNLEQLFHRYSTVAAAAAFVVVLGMLLYAFYLAYLVLRGPRHHDAAV
ncbi:hypothetical protein [Dactylosporangium sp. CA-139066]|uniref:hypothetical protein n=1 Tax=Dactylosporangium sp. CA-139066 TaxID=3239930 RepID=UPI003D911ACB